MLDEVMRYLALKPGETAVDCTLGGGGYTEAMARAVGEPRTTSVRGGRGRVLAIDADEKAIRNAEFRIKNAELPQNIILAHDNFANLQEIIKQNKFQPVSACVFDLGLSSDQLKDASRGFSFAVDAPLDMEFGEFRIKNSELRNNTKTQDIVNRWEVEKLKEIIKNYGEEKFAGRIARAIVHARPLQTTKALADVITGAVPRDYEHGRIHPATRTFQALRIATNDELARLKLALTAATDLLSPQGRLVVVSFHSLEDRIVKQYFKQEALDCLCPPAVMQCVCQHRARLRILTKKPITPSAAEVKLNPRARSAKLRAAQRVNSD